MDRVHTDRVRGGRYMRRVHSRVHTDPRVQEGRDGGQPDVLVRAGRRHAAHVRQRRAVRRRAHRTPAPRVLRKAVRCVHKLLHSILGHAGPQHDDRRVRLRLQLHEPRERLPADVPVRVHAVRANGVAGAVRGHTRHRAVVRSVPSVRQQQPVPGQPVVRRSSSRAAVRHRALRVPLEAQLPGGRVLHGRRVPDPNHMVVLVYRVRGVASRVVRHVRHGRSDRHRDRGRGHRVHTTHLHDDVWHCPRTDHQLAAVFGLRARRQRHRRQLQVHAGSLRFGSRDAHTQMPDVHFQGPVQPQLLLAGRFASALGPQEPAADSGQRVRRTPFARQQDHSVLETLPVFLRTRRFSENCRLDFGFAYRLFSFSSIVYNSSGF